MARARLSSKPYERTRLRKVAALARGETVLDLGYAQMPNPHLQGVHRVGLDLNAPEPGAPQYDEQLIGDVCDAAELLKGRRFDTIICGELIEHVEEPYRLLRDLRGLLADGGRLILTTPNPLGFPVLAVELLRSKRYFYTPNHVYYFLPRWAERLMQRSGYEVETVRGVGLWLPGACIPVCPVSLSYQVIYVGRRSE